MSTYNLAFHHAAAPMEPDQRAGLQTSMKIAIAVYIAFTTTQHQWVKELILSLRTSEPSWPPLTWTFFTHGNSSHGAAANISKRCLS
jgi:hypothetical protein